MNADTKSGAQTGELALEAAELTRIYGTPPAERRAVDRVSLGVMRREVVLIAGPSGSGKSTLLGLLGGLDRTYSGRLALFGQQLTSLSDRELSRLRGRRIGFVFQSFHLLAHLNVLENVIAPNLFADAPLARQEVAERGRQMLERVGLGDRALEQPTALSGGQRQRVAIARALLRRPDLLLCDEPTGNLDRQTGEQIIDLFGALHEELAMTLVIVTHEDRVARIADRTLEMRDGRLNGDGAA